MTGRRNIWCCTALCLILAATGLSMANGTGLGQYEKPASHRIVKTINRHWTFNYFPAENVDTASFQTPDYDDSSWPEAAVPHTWSTYETTGELHPFIRNPAEKDNSYWWHGWGWYRKHFSIDAGQKNKKVFIEFEGVQKYCKVWVNGQYLGDHKGGYSGFYFDITNAVGAKNDIIYTSESRLDELVSIIQPDFRRLSEEKKEAVLNYISRINPYVRREVFKVSRPRIDGKRQKALESVSYEVRKGKPILIPELTKMSSGSEDKKQPETSLSLADHDIIVYPPAATVVKS